jgi:CBS domain-containing protein
LLLTPVEVAMARNLKFALPGRPFAARLTQQRRVRDQLVSVAGLIGRPVRLTNDADVGRVVDVVVRWADERYPAVTGLVSKVGRRRAFVPIDDVAELTGVVVTLSSPVLDVRDFARRDGEVVLMDDIVDHQLVDIDGVQVVRASDLYLANVAGRMRLVGVEVGLRSLLRRLGPARWRARATPERVIDWADIQTLGGAGAVGTDRPNRELRRLRAGDLADLLEALAQPQRQQLVDVLDTDMAADALEEMDQDQRDAVLRNLGPDRAAAIVAEMEPDEAAEALRDLDDDERERIVERLPEAATTAIRTILGYPDHSAGGIMTTVVVLVKPNETVATVIERLAEFADHRFDIDAVLVVDDDGRLLDDVSLFELATTPGERAVSRLVGPPWPIVIGPLAGLDEVIDAVVSNRRGSVVVTDEEGRPLGRIMADDVVDALTPGGRSLHREVGEQ